MNYKPSQDQREALESEGNQKSQASRQSKVFSKSFQSSLKSESPSFNQYECNMIIWGKWKNVYDEPIQLNIECDGDEGQLKNCIVEMISQSDYCLFLTEDGKLYSMGQSDFGMLGLGKTVKNTLNIAKQIVLPDDQRVTEIKVGRCHALVLTNEGRVYGWGFNNHGQVGFLNPEDSQQQKLAEESIRSSKSNIIYEPQLIYPTIDMLKETEYENLFDYAKQIEVWEDSSFLVTEDGALYSWGKNDNGILGREAKLDVKMMALGDKKKKLTFSTFIPGRVTKLDKFIIKRMNVKDGKVMIYFAEQQDQIYDEQNKDSEIDSEEEKDIVVDFGGDSNQVKRMASGVGNFPQIAISAATSLRDGGDSTTQKSSKGRSGNNGNQDFGSTQEFRKQNTSRSNQSSNSSRMISHTSKGMARKNKNERDQHRYISEIIKRAFAIKEELQKFDRALADSVRPLTDLNDRNIYYQVIDKFAQGHEKINDADELRQAIDRMQVQLKKNVSHLEKIEKRINESLLDLIQARISLFRGDDELFKDLLILVDLLNESLAMKKFNLVGCKMKIYQERMKEINFLEMIHLFRENDQIDIDKCGGHLHTCKKLCKKIQESLRKNQEYYLQMHMNCSVTSSLAMSALTSSVYNSCDVWNGLNTLSSYTYILQSKIQDTEYVNDKVRLLWSQFQLLQKTDFNKKVEQFSKKQKDYSNTKEWFDAIMREIHYEIKNVMSSVRYSMKENKGENDILHYCQSMLHEACLIRHMLCSAQQALFEVAQNPEKQLTPGGNNSMTPGTAGGLMNTRESHQTAKSMMGQTENGSMINTQGGTKGFTEKMGDIGSMLGGFFTKKPQ